MRRDMAAPGRGAGVPTPRGRRLATTETSVLRGRGGRQSGPFLRVCPAEDELARIPCAHLPMGTRVARDGVRPAGIKEMRPHGLEVRTSRLLAERQALRHQDSNL